jgi:hypothetical protein
MAKFKPILGDLRGSIGDNTFSHNTWGDYVRRRVSPVNPQTSYQSKVRGWIASVARYYTETLTETQRVRWRNWGALILRSDTLGNSYPLTGPAAFQLVQLNRHKLLGATFTYQVNPPPLATVPADILSGTVTLALAAQTVNLAFTPTPVPAKLDIVIYGTAALPAGRYFVKKDLRFITSFGPGQVSPADLSTAWLARFGAFGLGEFFRFRIKVISEDSWLSSPGFDPAVVATP